MASASELGPVHPVVRRLVRRIQGAEASLGLSPPDGSPPPPPPPHAVDQAARLLRLYQEIGRPGNTQTLPTYDPESLAIRADALWNKLHEAEAAHHLLAPRIQTSAALARPGARGEEALAVAIDELAAAADAPADAAVYTTLAAASARVVSIERGCEVIDLARRQGVAVDDAGFFEQVGSLLGDGAVCFAAVSKLAAHAGFELTPGTFEAWALAVARRRRGPSEITLVLDSLNELDASFAVDEGVRNSVILVCARDGSEAAIRHATSVVLQQLRWDGQRPSVAACSGLIKWCLAQSPHEKTNDSFSEWHCHALAVEQAMVECQVQPTPQLLVSLGGQHKPSPPLASPSSAHPPTHPPTAL